jgi:hypothetical protein
MAMRKIPPSRMLTENLHCFKPAEIEKILSMEPEGKFLAHKKSRFGKLLEAPDARKYGDMK